MLGLVGARIRQIDLDEPAGWAGPALAGKVLVGGRSVKLSDKDLDCTAARRWASSGSKRAAT
jgi:hypothetical protein